MAITFEMVSEAEESAWNIFFVQTILGTQVEFRAQLTDDLRMLLWCLEHLEVRKNPEDHQVSDFRAQ